MQTYNQAIDYLTTTNNISVKDMSKLLFKTLRHAARFAARHLDEHCCDAAFVPVVKKMLFNQVPSTFLIPQSIELSCKTWASQKNMQNNFDVVKLFSTEI